MKSEDKNMQLEDIGKMIYLLLSVLRIFMCVILILLTIYLT